MARVPQRLTWAVELLDVRPADHILEIGCGPGHAVALVCERLATGTITAIDRSDTAVAQARARNADCIAAGRARIEQQALEDASFDQRFRKAFAINVNAFWTTPAPSIAALGRVLHPDGVAHLVYDPPSPTKLRAVRSSLPGLLEEHGFQVVNVRITDFAKGYGLCVSGRPAT